MPFPAYERGITRHPLVDVPQGLRGVERSVRIPAESADAVAALVSSWEFKRRAGFEVPSSVPEPGVEGVLVKRLLGIPFREPVRVVWADERGFGYETRAGHPLYGEESFMLGADGRFVVRSVSRPSTLFWRMTAPALRVLQRSALTRYLAIARAEADRGRIR